MSTDTKLAYSVTVYDDDGEKHVFGPTSEEIPTWAQKAITNPSAWQGGQVPSIDEEGKPYTKWRKTDLEAEVAERNTGRDQDDLIVVGGTGKVDDLAAALTADDDKSA